MITVHHLNNSRSQRILWMLEELGLKYEVKFHQRNPSTMLAPESLKMVHPLGKAPVLVDGTNTLVESGAILEYLVEKYGDGKFRPALKTPESLRYTFWMHFAEGSAMTPLLLSLIFSRVASPPLPLPLKLMISPVAKMIAAKVNRMLISPNLIIHQKYMEAELSRTTWFAGEEFTAADVQMSFVVEASQARGGLTKSSHPNLISFLERVHARPAYRRALEVGGPYGLTT